MSLVFYQAHFFYYYCLMYCTIFLLGIHKKSMFTTAGRTFRSGGRTFRSGGRTFRSGGRTFRSGGRTF